MKFFELFSKGLWLLTGTLLHIAFMLIVFFCVILFAFECLTGKI